ncbi:MAG: hypothetical protein WKF75_03960 [Singulisphaera sp.]
MGEKFPPFRVRGVFDADAGKELDFVKRAAGKPILLVFVHDVNRQSIGMTRTLTAYTVGRAGDGVVTGVVWLDDDAGGETTLKRIRHALTPARPRASRSRAGRAWATGESKRHADGPRRQGGKVTANFAMVQPSLQVDLPKILHAVVDVAGGPCRRSRTHGDRGAMRKPSATDPDPKLRGLIRPVIAKDASAEVVDKAAAAVEDYVKKNQAARDEVGRITATIVGSGKLSNYGTARAQECLRKWAEAYGPGAKAGKSGSER